LTLLEESITNEIFRSQSKIKIAVFVTPETNLKVLGE